MSHLAELTRVGLYPWSRIAVPCRKGIEYKDRVKHGHLVQGGFMPDGVVANWRFLLTQSVTNFGTSVDVVASGLFAFPAVLRRVQWMPNISSDDLFLQVLIANNLDLTGGIDTSGQQIIPFGNSDRPRARLDAGPWWEVNHIIPFSPWSIKFVIERTGIGATSHVINAEVEELLPRVHDGS